MKLLDWIFTLFYKHHISTWVNREDPRSFADSDTRLSLITIFFFFLIVPTYRLFWYAGIVFDIDWSIYKPIMLFGPMVLAAMIGWLITKIYFQRRGKEIAARLEIRKLKTREYFQLIGFLILFLVVAGSWSLMIGLYF